MSEATGQAGQAEWFVAAGSVVGGAHLATLRNNQDGLAVHATEDLIVAVVTDGCSSARNSEVGARLGARYLAEWIPTHVARGLWGPELLATLRAGLRAFILNTAQAVRPEPKELALGVEEFFLFTFLCAVVHQGKVMIFGLGDGVYSINGTVSVLDAGPDNAPPYLAYDLVREALMSDPGSLDIALHFAGEVKDVRSLVVGTDGLNDLMANAEEELQDGSPAGGLVPFEAGPELLENPQYLQKRLVQIGPLGGLLRDDTTLVVLRRLNA